MQQLAGEKKVIGLHSSLITMQVKLYERLLVLGYPEKEDLL